MSTSHPHQTPMKTSRKTLSQRLPALHQRPEARREQGGVAALQPRAEGDRTDAEDREESPRLRPPPGARRREEQQRHEAEPAGRLHDESRSHALTISPAPGWKKSGRGEPSLDATGTGDELRLEGLRVDSIYWVISRDCNQKCPHCYNDSAPGAPGLTLDQASRCIANLPEADDVPIDRVIISGGEILVWPDLLFHALAALYARYGERVKLVVQTNGDLLDEAMLDRLLAHHVVRVDVSSMDHYHPKSTLGRRAYLTRLLESRGIIEAGLGAPIPGDRRPVYAFWGATKDLWIGPLWPRGRARQNGLTRATPADDFCARWSGAKNFLEYRGEGCEVSVQLADVYPCCPMTCRPIGDLTSEPLIAMLDRCAQHAVYRALNDGRPEKIGEYLGISEADGSRRTRELGNQCLWCDEFFTKHAPELLRHGAPTERGDVDLGR
jgi:hypothetical protein